ncbi:hypothetical protein GLOIN_2v1770668 [Rhizophagus clarus]|uniref:Uncharacterized protein n=1 Tax=Rhizophagus clarus TaxID=94130 RepID=A0A8H3QIG3_9GLOM|nr:hypothetical protein GLOIN_2v1770668 [Rhizophagus clarus]
MPDLIYVSTNKSHIVSTDHSVVTAYFSYNNIFRIKAIAIAKRHNIQRIKFFVDKQCQELADHKRRVINSVLNHQRKCIMLDKILISNNGQMELCLDPDVINKEVTNHFQNATGKKFDEIQMQSRWQQQYQPIEWIDPKWQ